MAGTPASVAGIFTIRFGRETRSHNSLAWFADASVSPARKGLTSMLI